VSSRRVSSLLAAALGGMGGSWPLLGRSMSRRLFFFVLGLYHTQFSRIDQSVRCLPSMYTNRRSAENRKSLGRCASESAVVRALMFTMVLWLWRRARPDMGFLAENGEYSCTTSRQAYKTGTGKVVAMWLGSLAIRAASRVALAISSQCFV